MSSCFMAARLRPSAPCLQPRLRANLLPLLIGLPLPASGNPTRQTLRPMQLPPSIIDTLRHLLPQHPLRRYPIRHCQAQPLLFLPHLRRPQVRRRRYLRRLIHRTPQTLQPQTAPIRLLPRRPPIQICRRRQRRCRLLQAKTLRPGHRRLAGAELRFPVYSRVVQPSCRMSVNCSGRASAATILCPRSAKPPSCPAPERFKSEDGMRSVTLSTPIRLPQIQTFPSDSTIVPTRFS